MASNGRIPLSQLRRVEHATGGAHYLRRDASLALDRLCLVVKGQGHGTYITDSYRSYATQVRLRREWCNRGKCNYAAYPGTSNHGWGLAIDAAASRSDGFAHWFHASAKNSQLANRHGWHWPQWARPPGVTEHWHLEYLATLDRHRYEDPDKGGLSMADIDKLLARLKNIDGDVGKLRNRVEIGLDGVEAVASAVARLQAQQAAMERHFRVELDELRQQARRGLAALQYPTFPGGHTITEDGVDPTELPLAVLSGQVAALERMVRDRLDPNPHVQSEEIAAAEPGGGSG